MCKYIYYPWIIQTPVRSLYNLWYYSVNKLDARLDEKFSVSSQFINGTQ